MVDGAQVGVLVDQGLAQARGVFGVDCEDDGLLEAVAGFLQVFGDLLGHDAGALVQHQGAVEVLGVVDAVPDLFAVAVELAFFGTVAFDVAIDVDLDDLVGGEEAIADALFQGVGINRLSEVIDVGDVFGFFRCRGQADLGGAGEPGEDLAPGRVLGGAAAMALVDDDQVEELGRELLEQLLALVRPGDRLIKAEVDFVGRIDAGACGSGRGVAPRSFRRRARWSWNGWIAWPWPRRTAGSR